MIPKRWQQVKRILEDALEQEATARAAYLIAACAGDDSLRHDVELFLADDSGEAFLEHPAIGKAPPVPDAAYGAQAGTTIGHVDAVRPLELAPYTTLVVSTRSSRYELVVVAPLDLEVLVQGGRRFPERARARLCSQDAIRVGEELVFVVGTQRIVTTTIAAIEVMS